MPKITPFLTFNDQAEDGAKLYVSIFKNSKIVSVNRYGDAGPGPKGSAMVVVFELDGQRYTALNGGPHFKFSDGVSLLVDCCKTQQEVDEYWAKLSEGGEPGPCGWLKDRFGLSWQIVPTVLGEMMSDPDASEAGRVIGAMMKMKKLDIAGLEKAHRGV